MQCGPAGAVCGVDVEILGLYEDLYDGQVVVRYSPVQGETFVRVAERGEFGVRGEKGFDF